MTGRAILKAATALALACTATVSLACDAETSGYAGMIAGYESGAAGQFATNPSSTATGTYQFTYGTLVDLGYIDASASQHPRPGSGDWDNVIWTGQDGVYSRAQFMDNQGAQDAALSRFTEGNLRAISSSYRPGQVVNGIAMTDGGAAAAAHMLGAGGFRQWAASGFRPEGLNQAHAAAHGWTPADYQNHLMNRVARGSCADPANIALASSLADLPEIFLMPWTDEVIVPVLLPGTLTERR